MGMPRLRQAYTPHPVVDQSAAHLRAYIDGNDAISGRPFMQEVLDGLTVAARRCGSPGPVVRADDAAAGGARHRGQPAAAVRGEPLDGHASDRAADGGARRGDAQGHEPSAGQDRRAAPPDGVPRGLGIHRGEGGGQRRHGGCAARVPAGHPRAGRPAESPRDRAARRRSRRFRSSTARSATSSR